MSDISDILLLKKKMEQLEQLKKEIEVLQEKIGMNTQLEDTQCILAKLKRYDIRQVYDLDSDELAKLWLVEEKYRNIPQLERKFYYFEQSHGGRGIKKYATKFGLSGVFNNMGLTRQLTPPDEVFIGEVRINSVEDESIELVENEIFGYILKRTPGITTGHKTYRKIFEGVFSVVSTDEPYKPGNGFNFGHGDISDRFIKNGVGREYEFLEKECFNMMIFEGKFVNDVKHGSGEYYDLKEETVIKGDWKDGEMESSYQFDCIKIGYQEIEKHLIQSNFINSGAYGQIFRVRSKDIPSLKKRGVGDEVAVKIMKQQSNFVYERKVMNLMIKRGIECCARVDSEYILKIHGIIIGGGASGYVMDIGEKSVDQLLSKQYRNSGLKKKPIAPYETKLKWLNQVALGMKALHLQNIMHRDLKLGNILININNDIRITDFDTLKEEESNWRLEQVLHTKCVGSTGYISPEVFGGQKYGLPCDVYSYAMLCYALLWELPIPLSSREKCNCGASVHDLTYESKRLDAHVVRCNLRPKLDRKMETKEYPNWLKDLMELCWDEIPSNRPTFSEIVDIFDWKMMLNQNNSDNDGERYSFLKLVVPRTKQKDYTKKILVSLIKKDKDEDEEDDFEKFKERIGKVFFGSKVEKILDHETKKNLLTYEEILNVARSKKRVGGHVLIVYLESTFLLENHFDSQGHDHSLGIVSASEARRGRGRPGRRPRRRMRWSSRVGRGRRGRRAGQIIGADDGRTHSQKDMEIRRLRRIIERKEKEEAGRRRKNHEEVEGEDYGQK